MGWFLKKPKSVTSGPRTLDVVAFGENSVDLLAVVPEWPAPDLKYRATRFNILPGGQVATAAIGCARLGLRTRYLGVIGDDDWGGVVRRALSDNGVEARLVVRANTATRSAIVLVDAASGRRAIVECRDPSLRLDPVELSAGDLAGARLLMIDSSDPRPGAAVCNLAEAAGVPILLDADGAEPGIDVLLSKADVIITSAGFPEAHSGAPSLEAAIGELERRYAPRLLVVTRGAEGATARWDGRQVHVPARPIRAVDTTGAGDAFRAGFAAAWLTLGDETPVEELLRRANTAAALNCLSVGAQTGLPTTAELAQCL